MRWLCRQKLSSPQLSWWYSVLPIGGVLCVCVTLARAACVCLALGCRSIGRTQTLLQFELPSLYVTAFPLGCAKQTLIARVMCDAAVHGTGLLSTETTVSQPWLCQAAHTDPVSLWSWFLSRETASGMPAHHSWGLLPAPWRQS